MAGVLRFSSTGTSYNGEDFRVEIWDKNWGGAGSGFKMGASGPVISYDTDGDKKFSKIITSKFKFPFVVEDGTDETFINQLRNTYNERDVYVYVFNSSSLQPVWAGYIVLDLGDKEDVSFPYEVDLKAIDGLALLKDIDFVPDISINPPYTEAQTYIPENFRKVNFWLKEILLKVGLQTTNDSPIYDDYKIKTSVNWFNAFHPSNAIDPLANTSISSRNFYKDEEDENSTTIKYKAQDCYKVLEEICKTWGMRCVFWQGNVHFIQIGEYTNSETGTVANPVNIKAFTYDKDGNFISSALNLGDENVLYDLEFEDSVNLGLQKLSGTNYGFYPPIKEVTTNHLSISNQNNFQSFPLLANGGESTSTPTHFYETTSLGTFTDAHNFDGFYSQIMLKFNNQSGSDHVMQMNWTIRARQVGNPTWQKMIDVNGGGGLFWATFVQPTVFISGVSLVFQSQVTVINGISSINILNNEIGGGNIPTDASFTGDWEFEYYTHTKTDTSFGFSIYLGHGGIPTVSNGIFLPFAPTNGTPVLSTTYSNTTGTTSANSSMFSPVFNGVVGTQSQTVSFTTTSNSYVIDLKDLPFGDNQIATAGGMQVFNGTNFVTTDFTGEWGIGTTSGSETFTLLLCKEIMNNQQTESYKLGATSVLSVTNKTISSGGQSAIKQINPIGRIKDKDGKPYIFLRGDFNLLTDECGGEWFEFDYSVASGTATTTGLGGTNTGVVIGGSVPVGTSGAKLGQPTIPQQIKNIFGKSAEYVPATSSPIESLDVTETLTSTFKIGDVLQLFDVNKNKRYKLTLTNDYDIGDNSITFESLTFDVDINNGALIILDDLDLGEQYQRKSKGTVAGFDVDATSLEKGGISIDGFLDSDTMTGASATTLATSESIKAYVDNSGGGTKNYSSFGCTTTTTSSTTAGEANAVVIPFDAVIIKSATTTINNFGASGKPGVGNSAYSFSTDGGDFEISWTIGTNTNLVNNRILSGVKLQSGTESGGSIVWADLNPTDCFIYDRGNASIRKGSASGTMLVSAGASPIVYYRFMLWKEASSNAGTNAITLINSCQVIMKQIN